jgi:hypothetical protein
MPRALTVSVLLLGCVALPTAGSAFQNRDDGVLTVGTIVRMDPATRAVEIESAPVGTLGIPRGRPVNGQIETGDLSRSPTPEEIRRVGVDGGGPIPPEPIPRPVRGRVPVGTDGLDLPVRDRPARDGYRAFRVLTDDDTALTESGAAIDFDALRIGDRITVLGRVIASEIAAYEIRRSVTGD